MLRKVSLKFVWLFLILGVFAMSSQSAFGEDVMISVPDKPNGSTNPTNADNAPGQNDYYPQGTDVKIAITPDAGYILEKVLFSGADKTDDVVYEANGVNAAYTIFNVQPPSYRVDITFKAAPENKYAVTVAAGPGGTISPADPQITVYEGQTRKFTITPNDGYVVDDLKLNDTSVKENVTFDESGVGTYTLSGITANSALNATFKAIPKEFTITATAGEHGKIEPAEIIVKEGDTTIFTITPDSGYTIDKLLLDGVGSTMNVTENKFPLPPASADHKIHVTFKELPPVQHKITASAEENGTISPSDAMVNHGTSQVFTITPTGNYQVFDVLADGVSVGAKTSYTFENVTADHTINATFHLPGDADASGDLNLKDAVKFLQIGTDHKTAK